jgi:hypothetical protein
LITSWNKFCMGSHLLHFDFPWILLFYPFLNFKFNHLWWLNLIEMYFFIVQLFLYY